MSAKGVVQKEEEKGRRCVARPEQVGADDDRKQKEGLDPDQAGPERPGLGLGLPSLAVWQLAAGPVSCCPCRDLLGQPIPGREKRRTAAGELALLALLALLAQWAWMGCGWEGKDDSRPVTRNQQFSVLFPAADEKRGRTRPGHSPRPSLDAGIHMHV